MRHAAITLLSVKMMPLLRRRYADAGMMFIAHMPLMLILRYKARDMMPRYVMLRRAIDATPLRC